MIKFLYYTIILHSNYFYHIYYQASIPIKNLFQKKKITHYITDQTKRSEDLFAITLISIVLPSTFNFSKKRKKKKKIISDYFPYRIIIPTIAAGLHSILRFILKKKREGGGETNPFQTRATSTKEEKLERTEAYKSLYLC